jgi:ABC-type branched-subunit amino acid transport system ATPase component
MSSQLVEDGSAVGSRVMCVSDSSSEGALRDGLDLNNVSAWYGQARALHDVSIHVPRGSIVGLIGHNGAGKSTLLNAISRVIGSVSGHIRLDGQDVTRLRPEQLATRGVHIVREGAPVFSALSIEDHLELGNRLARVRGKDPLPRNEAILAFPELVPHLRSPAGILSGGQRQLLCLAVAVISRPTLLLLDEPSVGLSPEAARRVLSAIRDLHRDSGLSLLIAEQRIDLLRQMTKACYVLSVGRIVDEIELTDRSSGEAGETEAIE